MRDDLVALGMKDEYAEMVAAKWKANFLRLSRSVLGHTLTVNEITDMRWRFGGLLLSHSFPFTTSLLIICVVFFLIFSITQ